MYRSIVVGTDGSETAGEAVTQAAALAKLCDAELHVVMAFRPPGASALAATNLEAMAMGASESLRQAETAQADEVESMLRRLASGLDGVKVETHAVGAEAAEALISTAEAVKADLIVVGNRGMSGAKRFLLGSVPNRISHHAPCSVLIVKTC